MRRNLVGTAKPHTATEQDGLAYRLGGGRLHSARETAFAFRHAFKKVVYAYTYVYLGLPSHDGLLGGRLGKLSRLSPAKGGATR